MLAQLIQADGHHPPNCGTKAAVQPSGGGIVHAAWVSLVPNREQTAGSFVRGLPTVSRLVTESRVRRLDVALQLLSGNSTLLGKMGAGLDRTMAATA